MHAAISDKKGELAELCRRYAVNDLPELRRMVQALLAEMGPPEA